VLIFLALTDNLILGRSNVIFGKSARLRHPALSTNRHCGCGCRNNCGGSESENHTNIHDLVHLKIALRGQLWFKMMVTDYYETNL